MGVDGLFRHSGLSGHVVHAGTGEAAFEEHAREAQATRIFIGSENNLFSLSGSSVIAAPYRDAGGQIVGVVGVIGPTRLNYARIVPMVYFTAQALSRLMK